MSASIYPFLLVMFAVLMGMGVVRLMTAIAMYLRKPGSFRPYWVHGAWLLFLLLLYVHVWWSLWEFREVESWNYFSYLFMLLGPVALFIATSVLIPEADEVKGLDPRSLYFSVHRQFFGAMAVAVLWGLSIFPVLFGQRDPVLGWLLLFLVVVIVLAVSRRPAVHVTLTIIAWLLFLIWVLSYGFSLEVG